MKREHLKYYLCPECKGDLILDGIEDEEPHTNRIKTASIRCSKCTKMIPVINSIPRFVNENNSNYCQSFGFQWNRHRQIQLDKYNGYTFSHDRLYSTTKWFQNTKNDFVLEVGSGAGRFTQVLLETGAKLFSFDYSFAVDANLENNGIPENFLLFQGDLHHLPFHAKTFDKILCLGVLQHTPDPESAFLSLLPFLKNGGEIVVDVYKKTLPSMIQWKYLLRPLLLNVDRERLYNVIQRVVSVMLPLAIILRKVGGPIGNRLLPVANYSHLGIPYEMNKEFSVLDTFDMYAPRFDNPQTLREVKRWFKKQAYRMFMFAMDRTVLWGKGHV